MSNERELLGEYEAAVAGLVAHAALHAPAEHEEPLRELIIRGDRSLCDRCAALRKALIAAAASWRAARKRRKPSADDVDPQHQLHDHLKLGLTG